MLALFASAYPFSTVAVVISTTLFLQAAHETLDYVGPSQDKVSCLRGARKRSLLAVCTIHQPCRQLYESLPGFLKRAMLSVVIVTSVLLSG